MRRELLRILIAATATALLIAVTACGSGTQAPAPQPESQTPTEPAAPAAATPAGTAALEGTVSYDGKVPTLRPITMDADPGCAKKHAGPVQPEVLVLGEGNTLGNVLVRVKSGLPAGASFAIPSTPVALDQDGCQYKPHVLGVMVGQKVQIKNSDGLLHNVHALPKTNKEFNRAMPATMTEFEHTFDRPEEPFRIKCDVHPWMGAWVAVLEHPYHAVTAADGRFRLAGLPAGSYVIEAWHERLGTQTSMVTLADGESKAVDFQFTM